MKRSNRRVVLMFVLLVLSALVSGCQGCEMKCMCDKPSLGNMEQRQKYLKVTEAKETDAIATTQTQISNVSRGMAAAKILQALESYDAKLDFRLSTVYQVAKTDSSEGEDGGPAVTDVVVNGHYYYIAMLDYPAGEANRAAYKQTGQKIPAIAVVDAEDETRPAWIRTHTEEGGDCGDKKPYEIRLYLGEQEVHDPNNIYRFLKNEGYGTLGSHRLDNPTLEVDDCWKPYFTVTYVDDNNYGQVGYAWYAESFLLVDAQTREIKAFALDNPNTEEDEGAKDTPEWVDQIYSPALIRDQIEYWGYNTSNYGKTSTLNELHVNGSLDTVMNAANTNLVFVAFITSALPDNSMIGVMLTDPRTGASTLYRTQGKERCMAVKSAVVNVIRQATALYEYHVEDLTLHTIYGVPTWEGVLTKPAFNIVSNAEGKQNAEPYGSLYAATVLLRADCDPKPAKVVYAQTKHEAFLRYEQHLITTRTTRAGSNVLVDTEAKGVVESVYPLTVNGNTSFVVTLKDRPGELWEVRIPYVGEPRTKDVLILKPGDSVVVRYGDPKNRKTYFVREIHRANPPKASEEGEKPDKEEATKPEAEEPKKPATASKPEPAKPAAPSKE